MKKFKTLDMLKVLVAFVVGLTTTQLLVLDAADPSDNLILNKNAVYNEERNQIDYTLSAYSTGLITHTEAVKPTDLVLVLDQSKSMEDNFGRGNKLIRAGTNAPTFTNIYNLNPNVHFYNESGVFEKMTVERDGNGTNATITIKRSNGTVHETGTGSTRVRNPYFLVNVAVERIDALVTAVSILVTDTFRNAELHNVQHRISILGFSNGTNSSYSGTEILTTTSGGALRYELPGSSTTFETALTNSMMNVTNPNNQTRIQNAIYSIRTPGYTYTSLGVEMGKRVLEKHPNDGTRAQAMIVFTDGEPNLNSSNSFQAAADAAIAQSELVKAKNIPVYAVAVYTGANPATPVTNTNFNSLNPTNKINKFLHYLSSNYIGVSGVNVNRPVKDDGFYKVANDSDELTSIFESISETITTPSINLTSTARLVDVVVDEFKITDAANVTAYTQAYKGGDPTDELNWGPLVAFDDAVITVLNNTVSVTNYDYSNNYIVAAYDNNPSFGTRLVVKFSADVVSGFIGGNQIVTNGVESGIYNPDSVPEKVKSFEVPEVDIKKTVEFKVNDIDMYLTNELLFEDLIINENGLATYTLDGVVYEVDGLRNKHVDLIYLIKDEDDAEIRKVVIAAGTTVPVIIDQSTGFDPHLERNTVFTHSIGVNPINTGTVLDDFKALDSTVRVFKPVVTAEDAVIYLGEQYDMDDHVTFDKWCSGTDCTLPIDNPNYTKPDVTYNLDFVSGTDPLTETSYYPEYNSKFNLKVLLNGLDKTNQTTINSDSIPGGLKVDVLLKQLIVTKQLEKISNEHQSFIFNVKWERPDYLDHFENDYGANVVIVNNGSVTVSGLPIGEYTVTEDEAWSYRYDVEGDNPIHLELNADDTVENAIFKNVKTKHMYLSDEEIIENIFR